MSLQRDNRSNDEIEKLLKINDLVYSPASDLSVVSSRNWHKYYPDNGSSFTPGNVMNWTLSANNYIKGTESYIEFTLQASADTAASAIFSADQDGSAMNVINTALWTNGDEIDRSELCNLRYYHTHAFENTEDKTRHGKDSVIGHRATPINVFNAKRYAIPLKYILPSFDNESQLIPMGLIAGSRLKITLEAAATALDFNVADTTASYTVSDPIIYLAEYKLQEAAEMRLNIHGSNKPGLVYQYCSYNHQSLDMSSGQISRQVAPAVSHLVSVMSTVRTNSQLANGTVDSLRCETFPQAGTIVTGENTDSFAYSYRLGSVRYPQEAVDTVTTAYLMAQQALAPEELDDSGVSITEFAGKATDDTGHGVLAMTLNRSVTGGLSGVSLNSNSVQLWLDFNRGGVVVPRTIDSFSKHVRACSIFSDGKVSVNY